MSSKTIHLPVAGPFPVTPAVDVAAASATRTTWAARWVLMLTLVYGASAVVTVAPIVDPDIWWHLATGRWVVAHHAVPVTDPFSAYGAGAPWVAYSWLFGVLLYALHECLGHIGLVTYPVVGALAITSALLALVLRFEFRIPRALALTGVGVAAMSPLFMPRSYLFTLGFVILELYVLLVVRETGRTRLLWLLPPVFVLWANLHIQFVYGLLLLGLAVVESVVGSVTRHRVVQRSLPLGPAIATAVACGLATLVSPYGLDVYRPAIDFGSQRLVYHLVIELGAPAFRLLPNWVFLGLALAAAFTLGRQRPVQLFPALAFIAGAYLSFATRRDMWFLTVLSVAIIATSWGNRSVPRPVLRWNGAVAAAVGVGAIVVGVAMSRSLSQATLEAAVARAYPTAAVAAVKERGYPGPLYNPFDWGGFLIWRLPEHRVSMDGRSTVHGDERTWQSFQTSMGHAGWDRDADLRAARLVILPLDIPLAELLRRDSEYDIGYEDDVAVVFTRREAKARP